MAKQLTYSLHCETLCWLNPQCCCCNQITIGIDLYKMFVQIFQIRIDAHATILIRRPLELLYYSINQPTEEPPGKTKEHFEILLVGWWWWVFGVFFVCFVGIDLFEKKEQVLTIQSNTLPV